MREDVNIISGKSMDNPTLRKQVTRDSAAIPAPPCTCPRHSAHHEAKTQSRLILHIRDLSLPALVFTYTWTTPSLPFVIFTFLAFIFLHLVFISFSAASLVLSFQLLPVSSSLFLPSPSSPLLSLYLFFIFFIHLVVSSPKLAFLILISCLSYLLTFNHFSPFLSLSISFLFPSALPSLQPFCLSLPLLSSYTPLFSHLSSLISQFSSPIAASVLFLCSPSLLHTFLFLCPPCTCPLYPSVPLLLILSRHWSRHAAVASRRGEKLQRT